MRSILVLHLRSVSHKSKLFSGLALPVMIGAILTLVSVKLCEAYATGPVPHLFAKPIEEEVVSTGTLKIGINVPFSPFEYYSGTQLVGFDIDLMDAIALEAGFSIEYITVEWDIIFDTLIDGDVDALISALTIAPNREEVVDFTLPYLAYEGSGSDVETLGIAVPQGNSVLRHQMNGALWQLLNDGTIEELIDKYFDADSGMLLPTWPILNPTTEARFIYSDTLGNSTIIQVPAGAVAEPLNLEYTTVGSSTIPAGFSIVGQVFELDVYREGQFIEEGFSFALPVTIILSYSDNEIVGVDENSLLLERWDETAQKWTDAACGPYDRQPKDNRLAVPICHVSRFALVEEGYIVYTPLLSNP